MSQLGVKMEEITDSSDSINTALADRKGEIAKLCGVHHLLKKVQCLYIHSSHVYGFSSFIRRLSHVLASFPGLPVQSTM